MRRNVVIRIGLALTLLLMGTLLFYVPAAAEETTPPAPQKEREIILSTPYTNYSVTKDKDTNDISVSLQLDNFGKNGENVALSVEKAPENWKSTFKSGGHEVRGIFVLPGRNQSVDLRLTPPDSAKPGDYQFTVKAATTDGALQSSLNLTLALQEAEKEAPAELTLQTVYPVLRGPSGGSFEFKVDIKNGTESDQNVSLAGNVPEGWDVYFQPAYDQKQISTIQIKAGETQTVNVEVKSPYNAAANQYPIQMAATPSTGGSAQQITLAVLITGSHELGLSTSTGRLNTNATAGKATSLSLVAQNKGSAPLENLSLTSSAPEGWQITYAPDKLAAMNPGEQREIAVTIKPPAKAIAGDYSISLSASNADANAKADLRVTVDTPTAWGWIGIGALVVVIGGLSGLFVYLGRR